MPFSSYLGKDITIEYIKKNFHPSSKILDIGCGNGTYFNILSPLGYKLDGVEVYAPNIEKFGLRNKYQKLYEMNAMDVPTDTRYDLVIFGDVLEHFTPEDARKIIDKYKTFCDVILVSVPYKMGQGAYEGNTYEIHYQPDLTDEVFKSRYPEFSNLIVESDAGETIAVWVLDNRPTVMINILLKNSQKYFIQLMNQITNLQYPKEKISLVFLENDSEDDTYNVARKYLSSLYCGEYLRIRMDRVKTGFKLLPTERHLPEKQAQRLTVLKNLRNRVNHELYNGEEFVWNIDHDFMEIDRWLLNKMVSANKDVLMVPVYIPGNNIYDLGTGIFKDESGKEIKIATEILKENPYSELVKIDICSAACFFKGGLIKSGADFYSVHDIEQEGVAFSRSVRNLGAEIWLLNKEKIIHHPINGTIGR